MSEYVLAIPRTELTKQKVGTDGIYPFDLDEVDSQAYALLPRHTADGKDPETRKATEESVAIGKLLPQILGYFQITDEQGRILTYRRKGKEQGLLGKHSIGVGGHVDMQDVNYIYATTSYDHDKNEVNTNVGIHRRDNISTIISTGAARELKEEIGVDIHPATFSFDRIIASYADTTSVVHVGLPATIIVHDELQDGVIGFASPLVRDLVFSPDEYPGVAWYTKEELKALALEVEFETWSQLLIDQF